jgi:DMSO/TMAO reductase YedYZ heme-binding membrane subunit
MEPPISRDDVKRFHHCRVLYAAKILGRIKMKSAETRHVFSNKGTQWIITGVIYLLFFFFFIWYHDVRGKSFSLFTTEKCTVIASVCCLAIALALGPLSRFWAAFRNLLPYRRTLGITSALMTIPHVILVFAYLPWKFPKEYSTEYPFSWFVTNWFTSLMGFLAFVLFLLIAMYSYPNGIRKLNKQKWMILQKFAYLVMVLIMLHLLSTGKIPKNWIAWIKTRDYPLPPGSFPTMIACVVPLALKIVDLIFHGESLGADKAKDNT